MRIVVVDHVNLEERHVRKLGSLGDVKIYGEPPKTAEELKARIKEADIAIVGWSNLTRKVIDFAKRLRMISIWATTCH